MESVPKLDQSKVDFVCHDKKREAEAFSCWSETVKERFSALAIEAKGPIVHP